MGVSNLQTILSPFFHSYPFEVSPSLTPLSVVAFYPVSFCFTSSSPGKLCQYYLTINSLRLLTEYRYGFRSSNSNTNESFWRTLNRSFLHLETLNSSSLPRRWDQHRLSFLWLAQRACSTQPSSLLYALLALFSITISSHYPLSRPQLLQSSWAALFWRQTS